MIKIKKERKNICCQEVKQITQILQDITTPNAQS